MKKNKKTTIFLAALCVAAFALLGFTASAANEGGTADESTEIGDTGAGEGYNKNLFEAAYELACENLDKILSALAFCGTLLVGFAYKKGLLPTLERALERLSDSVRSINEGAQKSAEEGEAFLTSLAEKLDAGRRALAQTQKELDLLHADLEKAERSADEAELLRAIMRTQAELLRDIIMTSSLPQYMKDKAGESFAQMAAKLTEAKDEAAS